MDLQLQDKTVLITGGSRGIGFACASAFLAEHARVAVVSRNQGSVDRALSNLPGAIGFAAELSDADAAASVVAAVEERLGPIEILVNSAGAALRTPPAELEPRLWRAAMEAKFFSYIYITDVLIKRMAKRRQGVIANVIGTGGKLASIAHIPGGCANAALMLATAGLAAAYADQGVRVVGVSPGHTKTDRLAEGVKAQARLLGISEADARARLVAAIPLGRAAEPGEIANAVLFLASPKAAYITGVTLSIDGAGIPTVI